MVDGRGADPDRARRQGPGVGRGRGGRPVTEDVFPAGPRPSSTTGSPASACCRSRCAATPTGCPCSTLTGAADQKELRDARTAFDEGCRERDAAGGAAAGVRRGDPGRGTCCCAPATGGATAARPRGPSAFLAEISAASGRCEVRRVGAGAGRTARPTRCRRAGRGALAGRPARRPPAGWSSRRADAGPGRRRASSPTGAGGRHACSPSEDLLRARRGRRRPSCCWPSGPGPAPARTRSTSPLPGAPVGVAAGRAAPRPAALARRLRRPVPAAPAPLRPPGHRLPPLAGAAVRRAAAARPRRAARRGRRGAAPDDELALLQERFLASEWADRTPAEVEVPFETTIGGVVVRGRMDAVFADARRRLRVVDWKTGEPPAGRRRRPPRCSWPPTGWPGPSWPACRWTRVGAAFHYVRRT